MKARAKRRFLVLPDSLMTPSPQFITAEGAAPVPPVLDPVEQSDPFDGPAGSDHDDNVLEDSDGEDLGNWMVSFERQDGKMVEVDDVELNSFVISGIEDSLKSEDAFFLDSTAPVDSSTPNQTLLYDEDSSVIVTRALRRNSVFEPGHDFFLDPASFVSEEEPSQMVDDVDGPADGLMRSLSTMSRRGTSKKWKDQVTMTVKDELVLICFPEKLKSETYGEFFASHSSTF